MAKKEKKEKKEKKDKKEKKPKKDKKDKKGLIFAICVVITLHFFTNMLLLGKKLRVACFFEY